VSAAYTPPMRIITGKWKGRTIDAPQGGTTRPILDRVKESLFDRLGSRLGMPGSLPPIAVLELFAGGGTLGLEALSRGAAFCCFVEKHRRALAVLQRNLDALDAGASAHPIRGDACAVEPPEPPDGLRYRLVFVDPPYVMTRDAQPAGIVGTLCRRLAEHPLLDSGALIVLRHETRIDFAALASEPLTMDSRLVYGKMALTLLRVERT